ncbi:Uncharacterized protein PBTT_10247 [Plasmodiophora brassicae]
MSSSLVVAAVAVLCLVGCQGAPQTLPTVAPVLQYLNEAIDAIRTLGAVCGSGEPAPQPTSPCVSNAVQSYTPLLLSSPACVDLIKQLPASNADVNLTALFQASCKEGACASLFFTFVASIGRCENVGGAQVAQSNLFTVVLQNPDLACKVPVSTGTTCVRDLLQLVQGGGMTAAGGACPVINDCVVPLAPLLKPFPDVDQAVPWAALCQLCPSASPLIGQCQATTPPPTIHA